MLHSTDPYIRDTEEEGFESIFGFMFFLACQSPSSCFPLLCIAKHGKKSAPAPSQLLWQDWVSCSLLQIRQKWPELVSSALLDRRPCCGAGGQGMTCFLGEL